MLCPTEALLTKQSVLKTCPPAAGDEKENVDEKGKAPLKVIPTDQGSEDEDGAADADDAQLAWEMMEMARRIWEIDGTEKHLQELAGEGHAADTGEAAHLQL